VPERNYHASPTQRISSTGTKALKSVATLRLAAVAIAWAPIGLPLALLGILVCIFDNHLGHTLGHCGNWPLKCITEMWSPRHEGWLRKEAPEQGYTNPGPTKTPVRKYAICPARMHAIIGIFITILAVLAAALAVILFFVTPWVPAIVLWPMVVACGCVAFIGLIAYGIARHSGDEWWTTFKDLSLLEEIILWKRIHAVDPNMQRYESVHDFLNSWLNYDGNTDPVRWEKILDVIKILSCDYSFYVIGCDDSEKPLLLNLFKYCRNDAILVQVLQIFQKRFRSKAILATFFHGEMGQVIDERAG
jgi:hypothetical protein